LPSLRSLISSAKPAPRMDCPDPPPGRTSRGSIAHDGAACSVDAAHRRREVSGAGALRRASTTRGGSVMRVASYLVDGRPAWGLVTADGEGLVDATTAYPTVKAALAAGGLGDLKSRLAGRPADRKVTETR